MSKTSEILSKTELRGVDILNNSCFSVQAVRETSELIHLLNLAKLGLSDFNFTRVFDNGTAIRLGTNPLVEKYVAQKEIHITAHVPEQAVKERFFHILSENSPYSTALRDIQQLTLNSSCVNFCDRSVGYFDMFCFFARFETKSAPTHFINLKERLEHFSFEFRERAEGLIDRVVKNPFSVPKSMRPNFKGLSSKKPVQLDYDLMIYVEKLIREIELGHRFGPKALSKRQLDCVRLTLLGFTSTEISEKLGLSFRTVENYLANIREKFQAQTKSEMMVNILKTS